MLNGGYGWIANDRGSPECVSSGMHKDGYESGERRSGQKRARTDRDKKRGGEEVEEWLLVKKRVRMREDTCTAPLNGRESAARLLVSYKQLAIPILPH